MEQDRRRTPRYPFVAPAELIDESSGAKMTASVRELSLNGCYLDLTNPHPKGTAVLVKIFAEPSFFEAPAVVVYVQPNLGMGVQFHDVKGHFRGVLQKWLLKAMLEKSSRDARP